MVHKSKYNACVLRQGGRSYRRIECPYTTEIIVKSTITWTLQEGEDTILASDCEGVFVSVFPLSLSNCPYILGFTIIVDRIQGKW